MPVESRLDTNFRYHPPHGETELATRSLYERVAARRLRHFALVVAAVNDQAEELARLREGMERLGGLLVNKGIADAALIEALGIT